MIDVLVDVDDVSAIVGDKARQFGDDTHRVWAVKKQYGCGFHVFP